jgi:N4-(beta-N-acetylglucosaminyl)-L-asparaginase
MLGLEDPGHMVAASSTSGIAWKLPGRVGDSPIIGAGIYADDEAGAAGATGLGEELWKACASFRTVEAMRRGLSPQKACEETILHMIRRQTGAAEHACVVFAINKDGEYGAATTQGVFHLWACVDGEISVQEHSALAL